MLTKKLVLILASLAASVLTLGTAHAQVRTVLPDPTVPRDVSSTTLALEPGYFDHDLQFFAPADINNFGNGPPAPIGWYAHYSRMYWYVSRSRVDPSRLGLWTWGNRFSFGMMLEEDHGWDGEWMHVAGPSLITSGNTNEATGQLIRGIQATSDLQSFELSKVFRMKPLWDGSHLEMFIGGRYASFRGNALPNNTQNRVLNSMFGGQVGCRWFKKDGRFTWSAAGKMFPSQNFQYFRNIAQNEFVIAGDIRGQLAYNVTRDITIALGGEFLYFGKGIARVAQNPPVMNSEDVAMGGITLSLEFNR